jgi:hypothetical protein
MNNSEKGADERKEELHEQFDLEDDATYTLGEIVLEMGRYLSMIIGEEEVSHAMEQMLKPLLEHPADLKYPNMPWQEGLERELGNCYSTWPIGEELHTLHGYGKYGILLDAREEESEEDKEKRLGALVTKAQTLLERSPLDMLEHNHGDMLEGEVMRARNRWAMDHGQPMEPAAIASFGGLSVGRIKNLMSGSNNQFTNVDGKVPAKEALKWLKSRESFYNSIWREQNPFHRRAADYEKQIKPFFVPVARDGSQFEPELKRDKGFQIGKKGEEIYIEDYDEALVKLQEMPIPYWRRPKKEGDNSGWGLVRGVKWERMVWNGPLYEPI